MSDPLINIFAGRQNQYLFALREDFARIQNDVLRRNGFSIRVDHRTLVAQKEEAEQNGDDFLAKLCKRMPEEHIGIVAAHKDGSLATKVKKFREAIQHKQHSLFQVDFNQKTTAESETLFLVSQAEFASHALMNSTAYKSANLDEESLHILNQKIVAGLTRIRELKRELVGGLHARHLAQKQYLSAADYQFIRDYESKINQRAYLERLLHQFSISSWEYQEQNKALSYIELRIKEKNSTLRTYLAKQNYHYWAIQEKMQRPYLRKNIELVIHGLLQDDLKMKKQYEDAVDSKNVLMLKQVSPIIALLRAKNIFVHGGFDKLHAQQKSYEETLEQFEHDKSHYLLWEQSFYGQKWTSDGDRLREHYYLTKKKIYLEETERKLSATKIRLDKESARLENLCQTETAKEKIAFIAACFLFKNLKIAQEYEDAKKLVKDLFDKLQAAEKRFLTLNDNYSSMKKNRLYRVIQSECVSSKNTPSNENELTNIIADALLGEPYAVQLVACFDSNNLEMEKDWEMMSELDKDEFIHKKIVRGL